MASWASTLGAAGTGAGIGSAFGPVGTAVGAGIGALGSLFGRKKNKKKAARAAATGRGVANQSAGVVPNEPTGNAFTGYNAYNTQLPRLSPEQIQAVNSLLPGLAQKLGSQEFDFEPIEQKSREDFQRYSVPSLAARFASFGGGTSTSAYQDAMARAHGEHETGLAALKSQYGLQQQGQLQNLFGTLLTPSYENIYVPGTSGFAGGLAESVAPGLANVGINALSDYFKNRQSPVGTQADATAQTANNRIGGAATTAPANRNQMVQNAALAQLINNRAGQQAQAAPANRNQMVQKAALAQLAANRRRV